MASHTQHSGPYPSPYMASSVDSFYSYGNIPVQPVNTNTFTQFPKVNFHQDLDLLTHSSPPVSVSEWN